MATRATILHTTLTDIANAIRAKTGRTAALLPSAMPDEILGIETGVDTSDATAAAADVRTGKTFYAAGAKKTGTMRDVSVPTPVISVSSAGLITASATQVEGYAQKGTKSATQQLTVQGARTIVPGTSDQTISSGRYLTGTQTIKGDANLLADNIKSGVSIFGKAGTLLPFRCGTYISFSATMDYTTYHTTFTPYFSTYDFTGAQQLYGSLKHSSIRDDHEQGELVVLKGQSCDVYSYFYWPTHDLYGLTIESFDITIADGAFTVPTVCAYEAQYDGWLAWTA